MSFKDNWKQIDREALKTICDKQGVKFSHLSRQLGYGDGYISGLIYEERKIAPPILLMLADILGVEIEDITVHEEVKDEPTQDTPVSELEAHNNEQLLQFFKETKEALAELNAMVKRLDANFNPRLLTDKEKAVILLKQMLGDTNRCDWLDYTKKCNELNIDNHTREQAMESINCRSMTTGYGANAKKIITRMLR